MNIKKNFLAVENLKQLNNIGTNFNDRAIPISFMDFNRRYDTDKYHLLPIYVTQRNFNELIWSSIKSKLNILSVEIENNEELSFTITESIKGHNIKRLKAGLDKAEENEFEIKSVEVEKNSRRYKINKQGVLTVKYEETTSLDDVLYEKFIFNALGV